MAKSSTRSVNQVVGPVVKLPKHPNHCTTANELVEYCKARKKDGVLLGADLFAGAGGLSYGLGEAGIEIVIGVDHYNHAVDTHAAHFPGLSVDWDLSTPESVARVANLMMECGIEVLAGGPPCQPFSQAGRNIIRHLVQQGLRDPKDARRDLWRAYLEVVQLAKPTAVIMENVPQMALDGEMFIIRSMIEELEQLGYSVEERVVDTWRYGVPQFRQRLILVAIKDGIKFTWPKERETKVTLWNAIGDMPPVEGGERPEGGADGFAVYEGPKTEFQKYIRRHVRPEHSKRLYDHITRPVREDDRQAFEMMTPDTKYSELPEHLRRYRSDIFSDKYKKLDENDLCRTITAHIAKDGYAFIHPRQPRTLTVREAARVQTFPDSFRFSGPPSAAFKQIGNAVPVRLGEAVGQGIVDALERHELKEFGAIEYSEVLANWYRELPIGETIMPWVKAGNRWKLAIAEILIGKPTRISATQIWPLIDQVFETPVPGEKVSSAAIEMYRAFFTWKKFERRLDKIEQFIAEYNQDPNALWAPEIDRGQFRSLNNAILELMELACPVDADSGIPVLIPKGILRLTSRVEGVDSESRNKQTEGRLSVARMLGMNANSRDAHKAMIEIAQSVCTPVEPACFRCPLAKMCASAEVKATLELGLEA